MRLRFRSGIIAALCAAGCTPEGAPVPTAPEEKPAAASRERIRTKPQAMLTVRSGVSVRADGAVLIDLVIATPAPCERMTLELRDLAAAEVIDGGLRRDLPGMPRAGEQVVQVVAKSLAPADGPPGELVAEVVAWEGARQQSATARVVLKAGAPAAGTRSGQSPASGALGQPASGAPPGTRREGGLIIAPATPVE